MRQHSLEGPSHGIGSTAFARVRHANGWRRLGMLAHPLEDPSDGIGSTAFARLRLANG